MANPHTEVKTGNPLWDEFVPVIQEFLSHDYSEFEINGRKVRGYRSPDTPPIWLRDHCHQSKGFKYFEEDMVSALDVFFDTQRPDGSFYDFFVFREAPPDQPPALLGCRFFDAINRIYYQRCDVEADVEYLTVEAVHTAWQATGDDQWMANKLPGLVRGLEYSMNHPGRWSREQQLVKRDFTIDTWDFAYTGHLPDWQEPRARSMHDENTLWCIMHGDNSGMFLACNLLAKMFDMVGDQVQARHWHQQAEHFRKRTNEVCWNGSWYTHQVHITPVEVPVDEMRQISLSNPYTMNRGLPDHEQCVSIIREYQRRRERRQDAIAEWFSLDPPFPVGVFGKDHHPPGKYVNGGVMPLVGGELARAALEHGFADYGVDILQRYYELAIKPRETYLWYEPDGSHLTGEHFLATDGWGSAAMLYAFLEGLAGVVDLGKQFERVRISPRWAATDEESAQVTLNYAASSAWVSYQWDLTQKGIDLELSGSGQQAELRILLPRGQTQATATVNGSPLESKIEQVEQSHYLCFGHGLSQAPAKAEIRWA